MDRGLVIPRYRPDLGIGKSFVDYDMMENPTVDTTISTSFSVKTGVSPLPVTAHSEGVIYPRKSIQDDLGKSAGQGHGERFGSGKTATRLERFNSNPPSAGVSKMEKRRSPSSVRETSDQFSSEAVSARSKPLLTIPQQCGHQFSIKSPRYSDPSVPIESRNYRKSTDHNHDSKYRTSSTIEYASKRHPSSVVPSQLGKESRLAKHRLPAKLQNGIDDPFSGLDNSDHLDTENHRIAMKARQKVSQQIQGNSKIEVDDTSEDTLKDPLRSPSGLQERAQQAWKVHRQKNSSLRSKKDPKTPRSTNTVSFKGKDTVQYFEPHIEELTDDITEANTDELGDEGTDDVAEETGNSFEERSLNSEYTKGLESEVEDMIKDIFFIGNPATSQPGRRKYKYKHDVKKRLREKSMGSNKAPVGDTKDHSMERSTCRSKNNDADDDLETKKGGNAMSKQHSQNASKPERSETESMKVLQEMSEAEAALWNFVEGSVTAVSSALGLNGEETVAPSQQSKREPFSLGNTCSGPILPFEPCPGRNSSSKALRGSDFFEFYDFSQDVAYSPFREINSKPVISDAESESDFDDLRKEECKSSSSMEDLFPDDDNVATEEQIETRNLPFSIESLDEDPKLLELAQHAARSLHQSKGVEYDESNVISMHKDLQISVVELKLPLGLVFLENDGGCFVTKVSPEGSAARSGGVEVGDQLAYINGTSSIRMNVEDICEVISKARNPNCIELVLFRYVGPLCPKTRPKVSSDRSVYDDSEITIHSPEMYGHRSTFQLVSAYPPKEHVPKKKGFRLFGRTRMPIQRK